MHARAAEERELQLRERHYSRRFPKEIRKREANTTGIPYHAAVLRPRQVTNVIFTE